jgi:hypothetical protein
MGLDMYLNAKQYVNRNIGFGDAAMLRPEYTNTVAASGLDKYTDDESVNIYGANVSVVAAYWRKANQIHNWFVDNCQSGEDNCQEYHVSTAQLKELMDVCLEVLAHKDDTTVAEDLLPVDMGFSFGSENYDEWYYRDVEYTITRIKNILAIVAEEESQNIYTTFSYQASW